MYIQQKWVNLQQNRPQWPKMHIHQISPLKVNILSLSNISNIFRKCWTYLLLPKINNIPFKCIDGKSRFVISKSKQNLYVP
jgi:hypothetical protein